jgi:hypothetical protein
VLIDPDHLINVCEVAMEACCRYLVVGPGGFACAKHTDLRAIIDKRVAAGTFRAQGDNCPGLPHRSADPPAAETTIARLTRPP